MSVLDYFKAARASSSLPSPHGSLSKVIPSSRILAANNEVKKVTTADNKLMQRGPYIKYSPEDKAKDAILHGVSASLHHFKYQFPYLKWSTVQDWKCTVLTEAELRRKVTDEVVIVAKLHGKTIDI